MSGYIETPKGIPADVAAVFERIAFDVIAAGFSHYSADAILHRVRWHYHVERGIRTFKANNNWTAALARWFMLKHPNRDGFFSTRRSKEDA